MSQVRAHTKFGWYAAARHWYEKRRLGSIGSGVVIARDAELLRYPGNIHLGDRLIIKKGSQICACNEKARIAIGDNTTVGFYTFIYASEKIEIGRDCLIAPFVYIVDSDHSIEKSRPINQQPNKTRPIAIGDDVWIGTGAKILKGVTIGTGAVIAAGSLVKDDVEPYHIVGGTPARKLGERT